VKESEEETKETFKHTTENKQKQQKLQQNWWVHKKTGVDYKGSDITE